LFIVLNTSALVSVHLISASFNQINDNFGVFNNKNDVSIIHLIHSLYLPAAIARSIVV
jgi:hypothetical protein